MTNETTQMIQWNKMIDDGYKNNDGSNSQKATSKCGQWYIRPVDGRYLLHLCTDGYNHTMCQDEKFIRFETLRLAQNYASTVVKRLVDKHARFLG